MIKKNGIYTNYLGEDIPDIFSRKETDCCFFDDGEAHRKITEDHLNKLRNGELIITEYVDSPLGGVYYFSAPAACN